MMCPIKTVFVTGGAGFVGSHCLVELLNAGYEVIAMDNFTNAVPGENGQKPKSLQVPEEITGRTVIFYEADLLKPETMDEIFKKHSIDCVIHFAALKAVGQSVKIPLDYYKNNIGGTANLLEIMRKYNVRTLIFSSSSTVYGKAKVFPVNETHSTGQNMTNPYGRSKYFVEEMLKDVSNSEIGWKILLLRYFNPIGAHPSGKMGENPRGIPNNLLPFISQVAVGNLKEVQVFGNDFKTKDGTGERDYIHVMDLATGHLAALNKILGNDIVGCKPYNLGNGHPYTVLEMIKTFEDTNGVKVPYRIVGRRPGDVDTTFSDSSLAQKELGWKANRTLKDMCADVWRWQKNNPNGF